MSCFINDRRHFDSIIISMESMFLQSDFCLNKSLLKYLPNTKVHLKSVDMQDIRNLTQTLITLQIWSYFGQYNKSEYNTEEIKEIEKRMRKPIRNPIRLTPVGLRKAIFCALYQVEEDSIKNLRELTEEELDCIAFFKGYQANLDDYIVERLPEYNQATYSIK